MPTEAAAEHEAVYRRCTGRAGGLTDESREQHRAPEERGCRDGERVWYVRGARVGRRLAPHALSAPVGPSSVDAFAVVGVGERANVVRVTRDCVLREVVWAGRDTDSLGAGWLSVV